MTRYLASRFVVFGAWAALFLSGLFLAPAHAHKPNESYVYFDVTSDSLTGKVEVMRRDLARLLTGEKELTEPLTEAEVIANQRFFFDYFKDRIVVSHNGKQLPLTFNAISFLGAGPDGFAKLHFDVGGLSVTPVALELAYDAIFSDIDPTHRGFALIGSNTRNGMETNEGYISLVFGPGDAAKTLFLNDRETDEMALAFLEQGAWHVWLGLDHLVFLITLLLGSVMVARSGQWEPADSLRSSLGRVILLVILFTLAQGFALAFASFSGVRLAPLLGTALTTGLIVVLALGNLRPGLITMTWMIVTAYGLCHGLSNASILDPLGADAVRVALGIGSVSLGLALGQLAVVLLLFPLLYMLRDLPSYPFVALRLGSAVLAGLALIWCLDAATGAFSGGGEAMAGAIQ
ncbi:MAG: HupE/UreJ family protein [Rhodobacteraceae bacterium]|nr:HupE/UreJ family protein [Paracoccaceae bacterium]